MSDKISPIDVTGFATNVTSVKTLIIFLLQSSVTCCSFVSKNCAFLFVINLIGFTT